MLVSLMVKYSHICMGSLSAMDQLNLFQRKMKNTKLKLSDLNPHLMCVLCGGYYIDATTIVECLHSFCRSCIVKHLESSKYCPICEVQVHKTKPLINIRPDKTLQDIVYKLVPGLFANEMRNRRRFYKERPHYIKPNNSESIGEVSGERKIYINDENITFSLVYHTGLTTTGTIPGDAYKEISPPCENEKRYFKCPTGVTIYHLKKLLKTKYELNDTNYKMEVYLKDQPLHEDLTLLDISYIYLWKNPKGSLDFTYKIYENVVKRQKLEEAESRSRNLSDAPKVSDSNLQDLQGPVDRLPNTLPVKEEKVQEPTESVQEKTEEAGPPPSGPSHSQTQPSRIPSALDPEPPKSNPGIVKENGVSLPETKEVQLQISESGVMIVSQVDDGQIVRTVEDTAAKVVNNQSITGLSLTRVGQGGAGEQAVNTSEVKPNRPTPDTTARPGSGGSNGGFGGGGSAPIPIAPSKPVKSYKTIRCSPKTWHPVIPKEKLRPTLIKNTDEPKKPLKFFKMRNMPRFLGNPSSGVKPMYADPGDKCDSGEDKKKLPGRPTHSNPSTNQKPESTKKKILKIDPKTLRPIEKEDFKVTQTPNLPNLLTNPFIPNNNHFLFSDLHLLPPHSVNYPGSKTPDAKSGVEKLSPSSPSVGGFKAVATNGGYPPVCFPSPDHNPGFYPFSNLPKPPQPFPFPVGDKMDPLLRASRLSPFSNLTGFNAAGFHASLPPSISRLLNPHHHFRKLSQTLDKRNSSTNKDESTKDTTKTTKNCDDNNDSLKAKETDGKRGEKEVDGQKKTAEEEKKTEGKEKEERSATTAAITSTTATTTTTTTSISTSALTTTTTTSSTEKSQRKDGKKDGEKGEGKKAEENADEGKAKEPQREEKGREGKSTQSASDGMENSDSNSECNQINRDRDR